MPTRRPLLAAAALFVLLSHGPYAQDQSVPSDLTPLLAAPQSEMRMVVQRYNLDRTTLSGNYANGSGRGGRGGRGGPPAGPPVGQRGDAPPATVPPPPLPLSPARIARLKRFDTNWQVAVGRIDAAKLTPPAKTDLDGLKSTIAANLARLDAETLTMAQAIATAPFAPKLVQLVEARIRVEDMNAQRAAATITDVTREIARLTATPPRVNREQAVARRDRRGSAADDHDRVVHLL